MTESVLSIASHDEALALFGEHDRHLREARKLLDIQIHARDGAIHFVGVEPAVSQGYQLFRTMQKMYRRTGMLVDASVREFLTPDADKTALQTFFKGRNIRPRTPGQVVYVKAIATHAMVFCSGPAGTGKTYLAVAAAVDALQAASISRIILVRPVVEAGESLGFLPGDIKAKVNPYVRPLVDALHDMMEETQIEKLMHSDVIEVVPLAYMRGRSLNHAFIILDEAQNCTQGQMQMLLTRFGEGSKIVITGDPSQTDLAGEAASGLDHARMVLRHIHDISFVDLSSRDIIRHPLIQKVVDAYDRDAGKGVGFGR